MRRHSHTTKNWETIGVTFGLYVCACVCVVAVSLLLLLYRSFSVFRFSFGSCQVFVLLCSVCLLVLLSLSTLLVYMQCMQVHTTSQPVKKRLFEPNLIKIVRERVRERERERWNEGLYVVKLGDGAPHETRTQQQPTATTTTTGTSTD